MHPSDDVVCHYYTADPALEITDPVAWEQACPAISAFRSVDDIRAQAETALRLPSAQASFENLILNRRISLERLYMSPQVFKKNMGAIDLDAFRSNPVSLGLDLSQRNDLTAAVAATRDADGIVHLLPFVFCPSNGIEERSRRDRTPYADWCRDGYMIPIGGDVMDYRQIAEYLRDQLKRLNIEPNTIEFDAWRIDVFRPIADEVGFGASATWNAVRQGFQTFSPILEGFEALALEGKLRTGAHPLLSMAFSNAIAVTDPAGNRKLDKSKSSARIDPAVAAVMAAHRVSDGADNMFTGDVSWLIA
jgi:phage terminase large subunit-like protein